MKKKCIVFFALLICLSTLIFPKLQTVRANELTESIQNQLEEIDLSGLLDYQDKINFDINIIEKIKDMLNGKYDVDYASFGDYIINVIFAKIKELLPSIISIAVIVILFSIVNSVKSSFASEGISEIIFYVCFGAIAIIVISQIISIGEEIKNTIKNLSILCQIMSPIILSLMIASGGSVSATIYSPAVAFLSTGIISFILTVIMPLISVMLIFDVLACSTSVIKIKKYSEIISSIIKWCLGIIVTIFSVFITIQGISGGVYDGISLKATKYLISNSVPIIGNFIGGGFDFIIAGSVLIKNAVGVGVVFLIIYTILSPVIFISAYSLLLKLIGAFSDSISDNRFSELCLSVSKHSNYLLAMTLLVGVMLLVVVLLMTFSANALF